VSRSKQRVVKEYIESIIVAVVIALILRVFVVATYRIPTSSMVPAIRAGDYIFAWKLPYTFKIFGKTNMRIFNPETPKRGDVMVFRYPDDPRLIFVKRVVGISGDRIEIKGSKIILNGKEVSSIPVPEGLDEEWGFDKNQIAVQKESMDGHEYPVIYHKEGRQSEPFGPQVVPDGFLFVLGDNRDNSDDSRYWGLVPLANLEGRAFMIWASFNWDKKILGTSLPSVRWNRIAQQIR
jgi:signal peptidase I